MRKVPPQGDAAQLWIHQYCAVSVVPGETKQARLSGLVCIQSFRELDNRGGCASRNRIENVTSCGEACFDPGVGGMDRTQHHAADPGHERRRLTHANDA